MIDLRAADLRQLHCPACKRSLGATGYHATDQERAMFGETTPSKGDVSTCPSCGAILIFTVPGIRLMTLLEINAMPKSELEELTLMSEYLRKIPK